MALPFSQSMRSLQADRGIPALVWLGVALTLFLLWIAWFFWAPITQYESGRLVGTTRDGRPVAEFPSSAYAAIRQGQDAYIRPHPLDDMANTEDMGDTGLTTGAARPLQVTTAAIPAVVANILGPPSDGFFRVSFSIQPTAATVALLEQNLAGEVAVEVEHASPAQLVARASGQLVDSPALSFSPSK